MHDENDSEFEFWSRVDDRRLDRVRGGRFGRFGCVEPQEMARHPRRSTEFRSHTEQIPTIATPVVQKVREATSLVDPMLRRSGLLLLVVALLVPVALSLRSEGTPRTAQAEAAAAVATLPVGAADTGVPADALATPAEAADPFANIDIDALPAAVPVNPDPTPSAASVATADFATTPAPTTAASTTATSVVARNKVVAEAVPKAVACSNKYTVRRGDAWIVIAQRAKVTVKALLAANGATTKTALYPGRKICLPRGARVAAPPTTTTAPKPKPTPTPTTTVPARTYTKDQVRAIIRAVWPDNLEDEAIRIATRESNLVPTAGNFCCIGLFQIYWNVHQRWLTAAGITSAAMLKDPQVNAYAAYLMYQRAGGWGPWR